ncbi:hypothetical protein CGMCC3_g3249 [Colletotrichum fructicola]|nr:uncharacterized protein CGMCC3_g3249 [Colletotrichum fructicola]KAE9580857.1 hypothetical protein CGMCC3_g3249 [Colletotrichum fructicola]
MGLSYVVASVQVVPLAASFIKPTPTSQWPPAPIPYPWRATRHRACIATVTLFRGSLNIKYRSVNSGNHIASSGCFINNYKPSNGNFSSTKNSSRRSRDRKPVSLTVPT